MLKAIVSNKIQAPNVFTTQHLNKAEMQITEIQNDRMKGMMGKAISEAKATGNVGTG